MHPVSLIDLPVGAVVEVQTQNTLYTIKKITDHGDSDYTIQGHETLCPTERRVFIAGSRDRTTLKLGVLEVGMWLEFGTDEISNVTTTEMQSVRVVLCRE